MPTKGAQPFTMRITPRTRFQIELLRRVTGQSIKTLVAEAIREAHQKLTPEEIEHAEQDIERNNTGRAGRRYSRAGHPGATQHQPADHAAAGERDADAGAQGHPDAV